MSGSAGRPIQKMVETDGDPKAQLRPGSQPRPAKAITNTFSVGGGDDREAADGREVCPASTASTSRTAYLPNTHDAVCRAGHHSPNGSYRPLQTPQPHTYRRGVAGVYGWRVAFGHVDKK